MICLFFLPIILLFLLSSTVSSQNPNMFDFDLNCDKQSRICDAINIFNQAGQIISDNLVLTRRISVRVLIYDTEHPTGYGSAFPGTTIYVDPQDGGTRLYPTALLKQLDPSFEPEEGEENDIFMELNYDRDEFLWFPGMDSEPIQPRQIDFLEFILHQLHHGLGIYSSWIQDSHDIIGNGLLPNINYHFDENIKLVFDAFYDTIFDKYLVSIEDGVQLTTYVNSLNDIAASGPQGRVYDDIKYFLNSLFVVQRQGGKSYSRDMTKIATTLNGLGFLLNNDGEGPPEAISLETSYNPLVERINIEHLSYADNVNTSDFLFVSYQVPGISLQDKINANGNVPGGGVGPSLMAMLETLGYKSRLPPTSLSNLNLQNVALQKK